MAVTITALTALGAAPATTDVVPIVDVSDTTQSGAGSTKKITVAFLFTTPTLTGPVTITGAATVSSTLDVAGNFSVATNKLTVAAASGNLVSAGSLTGTTLALSDAGAVIARSGASTTNVYLSLANTSGVALFGTEGSAGSTLITGASAYDTVVRGPSGVSFSASGGVLHGRIAGTTGTLTWNAQLIVTAGGAQITGAVTTTLGVTSSGPTGSGIGYTAGAGGTVTQATNRTTGVTLDKLSGAITTNNASLAAEATAVFTVTNSTVAIGDTVNLSQRSGSNGGNTKVFVSATAAGSFAITVANDNPAGGVAETGAIVINYAVFKGVSA